MLAIAVYAHNPPRANSCSDSAKSGLTRTGPDYDRQVYLHVAENVGILDINCGERTRLAGQRQQPLAVWRCPCTLSGPVASLLLCCFNYFTLTFIKKQEYEQTIFPERDIKKKTERRGSRSFLRPFRNFVRSHRSSSVCSKKKILFLIYLKECVESVFVWKERSS